MRILKNVVIEDTENLEEIKTEEKKPYYDSIFEEKQKIEKEKKKLIDDIVKDIEKKKE